MLYGLYPLPWWGYVLVTLVLTHITIAAVTIYLHRHSAHRALELHPIASHFFRLWLWLTTGMETKAWTAIHRKHHAKCETDDDPHSPQILGIYQVLWEGAELYRKEGKDPETLSRYGAGTPDDWLERNIYVPYSAKGIFLTLAVNILLFGVPGIAMWAVQMAWIPFFAAGVINGIGHFWGYRNFDCPDAARNVSPWGLLIGGEELHNNHHTYPTSAKMSIRWWEFDIGWLYIRFLSLIGLAKVKRVAPRPALKAQLQIDSQTLKAIISNRIQVMSCYTKQVTMPVFKQELLKARARAGRAFEKKLWLRAKRSFCRESGGLDEGGKASMDGVLAEAQQLQVVYQFKERLQAIWSQTTATQKELIDALQDWCRQAEATGIRYLEDFSTYLKRYALNAQYG